MTNEALFLASEAKELEALLASIPAGNFIERMSLEARLVNVRKALDELPTRVSQKVKLTFRGTPVLGSHGIAADFGAKAAGAFSDAFAAIAAALSYGLREMGPIPDRDKNQLLITGIAIGSFGFEFELPAPQPSLFPEATKAQEAVETIQSLFRLTTVGSDDEVAEVIEKVHPRAVRKVHEFLELLVQHRHRQDRHRRGSCRCGQLRCHYRGRRHPGAGLCGCHRRLQGLRGQRNLIFTSFLSPPPPPRYPEGGRGKHGARRIPRHSIICCYTTQNSNCKQQFAYKARVSSRRFTYIYT